MSRTSKSALCSLVTLIVIELPLCRRDSEGGEADLLLVALLAGQMACFELDGFEFDDELLEVVDDRDKFDVLGTVLAAVVEVVVVVVLNGIEPFRGVFDPEVGCDEAAVIEDLLWSTPPPILSAWLLLLVMA